MGKDLDFSNVVRVHFREFASDSDGVVVSLDDREIASSRYEQL